MANILAVGSNADVPTSSLNVVFNEAPISIKSLFFIIFSLELE